MDLLSAACLNGGTDIVEVDGASSGRTRDGKLHNSVCHRPQDKTSKRSVLSPIVPEVCRCHQPTQMSWHLAGKLGSAHPVLLAGPRSPGCL